MERWNQKEGVASAAPLLFSLALYECGTPAFG
jgi:hypothetical protein